MTLHFRTKIPVTISAAFWIFAAIIGFLNSMSLLGTLIWVGIIFVSVLFHEFGHALTAALFGRKPRIELVALGGLTYHDGEKLSFWKQFFIVLDGPLFGFLLFVFATLLLRVSSLSTGMVGEILGLFQRVNLFWTLLNLLPVLPLDGGQLLRVVLEAFFGVRGFAYALLASVAVATGMSLVFFLFQYFLVGALFFLLAFQSYETWRTARSFSEPDRNEELKRAFESAENAFQRGALKEAETAFERIRREAQKGMIYSLSTQHLAALKASFGKNAEAYELLFPIRSELAGDSLCLLQKTAFEEENYPLALELAGECFQASPTADVALLNAYAAARLSKAQASVGWLQTAFEKGLQRLDRVMSERRFDLIREDPLFREFLEAHREP